MLQIQYDKQVMHFVSSTMQSASYAAMCIFGPIPPPTPICHGLGIGVGIGIGIEKSARRTPCFAKHFVANVEKQSPKATESDSVRIVGRQRPESKIFAIYALCRGPCGR